MSVTHNQTATKKTHPHSVVCDSRHPGCEWRTAHSTYEEAVRIEATHPCPHLTLKRTYMTGVVDERGMEYTPPNRGKTLAESAWDMLDAKIDELIKGEFPGDYGAAEVKGWCQALCWTIHMWTPHYYKTPDEVKVEAGKRREIRLGQRDFEPTPGYQYNPMPPSHRDFARINKKAYMPGEAAKDEAREADQRATQNKAKAVSPADVKLIKDAYAMFNDADEVARILSIDVNVVKSHI